MTNPIRDQGKLTVLPRACTTVLSEQFRAALLEAGCWLLAWLLLSGDEFGVVALLQHGRAVTLSPVCISLTPREHHEQADKAEYVCPMQSVCLKDTGQTCV